MARGDACTPAATRLYRPSSSHRQRCEGRSGRSRPPPQPHEVRLTVTAPATADLAHLIAPVAAAQGLALVRVQMNGRAGETLQVMAEDPATGQLTLAQCEALSRALSDVLDAADPIAHEYALEVSSPGIDRPLTRLGDWAKWAGHDVRAKLASPVDGHARLHGTIRGVDDENVVVDMGAAGPVTVPFAAIDSAKLVLTNKLIAATRPLDFDDAEEFDESPRRAVGEETPFAAEEEGD